MTRGVYVRKIKSVSERLWAKIDKSGGPDACWLWTGSRTFGYGRLNVDKIPKLAHRLAYEDAVGPIPEGFVLRHLCESRYPRGDKTCRLCCNPAHLAPGTDKDNTADAISAGRNSPPPRFEGSAHGNSKLTEAQVLEMRARYAAKEGTTYTLAREYGVHQALVWRIVARKIWTHV
jgi:hypothetical protein